MLSITAIKETEDCLDDLVIREYFFDQNVSEEMMYRLASGASLQYFPHFPRPFYKIQRSGRFLVQGIVGNDYFRVIFSPSIKEGHDELVSQILGITEVDK